MSPVVRAIFWVLVSPGGPFEAGKEHPAFLSPINHVNSKSLMGRIGTLQKYNTRMVQNNIPGKIPFW